MAATDRRSPSPNGPRSNAANIRRWPRSSCGIYVTFYEAGDVA
jgi:hypothetical protein